MVTLDQLHPLLCSNLWYTTEQVTISKHTRLGPTCGVLDPVDPVVEAGHQCFSKTLKVTLTCTTVVNYGSAQFPIAANFSKQLASAYYTSVSIYSLENGSLAYRAFSIFKIYISNCGN